MMGLSEFDTLEESQRALLFIRASATARIQSIADLQHAIAEYVHLMTLQRSAVRCLSLNRKFLRAAQRLGTSVAEVADALAVEGILLALRHKNVGSYASTAVVRELQEAEAALSAECRPAQSIIEYLAETAR